MLNILRGGERYREPCALLLGGFDGLHAGHMSLVAAARRTGLPLGATVLCGNKAGVLFTFAEREYIFEKAGFSFVLEEAFTEEFKRIPAEEYLRTLFSRVNAAAVFCGEDYRFGSGAAGTAELLQKLAPCPAEVLPLTLADGKKVSVSEIKRFLQEGDVENANRLLAVDYFVQGEVEHGRQVGRSLGFPTANVSFDRGKLPLREGVYGGRVETDEGKYPAIVNVGARPTFGVAETKIEAHLKDFHCDLYGKRVRVFPESYLRPVVAFKGENELILQLEKDKRKWFHD